MSNANRWRDPAWRAAALNAVLVVFVPVAWLTYADYTADVVRPDPRTVSSAFVYALRTLFFLWPLALFVGWRTHAHAQGYCARSDSIWRGPFESAALAGGIALVVMLGMTMPAWTTRPPLSLAGYVAFYVIGTALIGLIIGMLLAGAALFVLRVSRRTSGAVRAH